MSSIEVSLGDVPFEEARLWRNDPLIWRWCRQHTHISEDEHEAWRSRVASDPSIRMLGIYQSQTPVGVCGLTSIDRVNQNAEFSLYIGPQFHRKGYGKQALVALLGHGFYDHNLELIYGETFDGNPALKIFTDVGMTKEATLRRRYFRNGQFIDVHIVSMLRGEFESGYERD